MNNNHNVFVKVDGHSYLNLNEIHNIYVDSVSGFIRYGGPNNSGEYKSHEISKELAEKILKHCEVID